MVSFCTGSRHLNKMRREHALSLREEYGVDVLRQIAGKYGEIIGRYNQLVSKYGDDACRRVLLELGFPGNLGIKDLFIISLLQQGGYGGLEEQSGLSLNRVSRSVRRSRRDYSGWRRITPVVEEEDFQHSPLPAELQRGESYHFSPNRISIEDPDTLKALELEDQRAAV